VSLKVTWPSLAMQVRSPRLTRRIVVEAKPVMG